MKRTNAWVSLYPSTFRDPNDRERAWARWEATIAELDAAGLGDAIGFIPRPRRPVRKEDRPDMGNLPPLLTIPQTAAVIGRSVRAVEAMVYRGELPTTRVGKRGRRIKRDLLMKILGVKHGKR